MIQFFLKILHVYFWEDIMLKKSSNKPLEDHINNLFPIIVKLMNMFET